MPPVAPSLTLHPLSFFLIATSLNCSKKGHVKSSTWYQMPQPSPYKSDAILLHYLVQFLKIVRKVFLSCLKSGGGGMKEGGDNETVSLLQLVRQAVSDLNFIKSGVMLTPINRGVEKYLASVMLERTYAHSMTFGSPFRARHRANVKRAPANAMDSVAEPAPAFAFTTSVPASCTKQHSVSRLPQCY
jgi:hypothetical protein